MTEFAISELTPSALDQAYAAGELTLERVRAAIGSVDDDGYEGIPWSRGMRWIGDNQPQFLKRLQLSNASLSEFFRGLLSDEVYIDPEYRWGSRWLVNTPRRKVKAVVFRLIRR